MAETDPTIAAGAQSPATTMAPGGVDPAMMAQMISGIQQQGGGAPPSMQPPMGGGVLPPSTPAPQPPQVGAGNNFDLGQQIQQMSNIPQIAQPMGQLGGISQQEAGVQQQISDLQQPKFGPRVEKGKGFLHNLGQALLMASEVTGAGRDLNQAIYGPGVRAYEAKSSNLAQQLQTLRGEEEVPKEQLQAETGLGQAAGLAAYRGNIAGARQETADASMMKAQAAAQSVTERHANDLVKQQQGWAKLSLEQKQEGFREWYDKALTDIAEQRIAAGEDENQARVDAAKDIAGSKEVNAVSTREPWMSQLLGMGGIEAPTMQVPQGAQTQPAGSAAKKGATKPAYQGPDGSWYSDPQFKNKIK